MPGTGSLAAPQKRPARPSTKARNANGADTRAAQIKAAWDRWPVEHAELWAKFQRVLKAFYRADAAHYKAIETGRKVEERASARAAAYAALVEVADAVDVALKPMLEGIERLEDGEPEPGNGAFAAFGGSKPGSSHLCISESRLQRGRRGSGLSRAISPAP
jgi:hypothetical protein